ncbi:MAG: hypothetical protein ABIW83_00180 [Allosphingosinicella sp.]
MGCCSPFKAIATGSPTDPHRHVNFTSGMVLGVDDYRQEFAYHSERDKWIVRDFLGYGTLSGLAVSLEDTADGPRVRVTPGAAAAPSGQLICIGREQCGSLNPWLARKEIKDKLQQLTNGAVDPDHARLNLYLTLCYVDCPVAEVPIPGEPCRSDENLMAPSRIADDYALSFAFEPPPMAEAVAVDGLETLWHNVAVGGVANSAAAFADAMRKAELQLRMALGLYPADAPAPPPADLLKIDVPTDAVPRFRAAVRNLWVTRLRPLVAAQSCAAETLPAQDCVLLAQLWLPVVRAGAHWEVDGAMAAITLDETSRPVLLCASLAQTGFGAEVSRRQIDQADPLVAVITAAGTIAASTRIAIVRPAAAIEVKLPVGAGPSVGRELTVKNGGAFEVKLTTPANTKVEGEDGLKLAPSQSVSLVCDGNKGWHITGRVQ